MILFLASILEQLDLSLEHVVKGDVHNARFGLMLTDNAVELVLHQIATDKALELRTRPLFRSSYEHIVALEKAQAKSFGDKVKFARIEGHFDINTAQSINIMHGFRNEIYHVGIRNEAILPALACFYFEIACSTLSDYRPWGVGWSSSEQLPERAKKYFNGDGLMPGSLEDFANGCRSLAKACGHDSSRTIAALADHMSDVVSDQDVCIGIVAAGVYEGQQTTRDQAVIRTQAWQLAFSEDGRRLAEQENWSRSVLEWVEWLADNHSFPCRSDPIGAWERQVANLRAKTDPHSALHHYHSFMTETESLREALEETARQAEREIDAAIDRMRGK